MKTLALHSAKNSLRLMICVLLLTISSQAFSQNKIMVIASQINYHLLIPVAFVTGVAIFLFTLFIKQKNH
jgi:hypothetical protein